MGFRSHVAPARPRVFIPQAADPSRPSRARSQGPFVTGE